MSNAVIFLNSFNEIDKELSKKSKIDIHKSFSKKLEALVQKDKLVRFFENDLKIINSLRNVMVHENTSGTEYIADPNDKWVEKILFIQNALTNPRKAIEIAIRDKNIYTCELDSLLQPVLQEMITKNYSLCPVVDKDGSIIKVLSEHSILKFMAKHSGDSTVIDTSSVRDIEIFLDKPNEENDTAAYKFIPRDFSEFELETIFNNFIDQRKRLLGVFITENGKPSEKLLGLFTSWDLPNIGDF